MRYKYICLVLEDLTFPKNRTMSGATKAFRRLLYKRDNLKNVNARLRLKKLIPVSSKRAKFRSERKRKKQTDLI